MATVIWEALNACAGCEVSLLNLGAPLLEILPHLDILHFPMLMDSKYTGPQGNRPGISLPKAQIGIVSGGVRNEEHLDVLRQVRASVDVLVALGTCAATGGLPGLANLCGAQALEEFAYGQAPSNRCGQRPVPSEEGIPALLAECAPLSRHVVVDMVLPGCPPHPDWIAEVLHGLLDGREPVLPDRSVCSVCPACPVQDNRQGKVPLRNLAAPVDDPAAPLSSRCCFLAQGYICLGPVTRAGCGGRMGAPLCVAAGAPCRGCYGPPRPDSMPHLDFLEALAVSGFNPADMPDKPGYLSRFTGALERPAKEKP
jgi:F420-non-reducing hydrogenase small subunit